MKKEFLGFNIVKDFACIWVIMVHLEQRIYFPPFLATLMQYGSSGVNIFFILSGFGCFSSLEKVQEKKETVYMWWKKRFFKIMPAYYTVILIYFIFYQIIIKNTPPDEYNLGWLRYILCINQIIPSKEVFWSNLGATWTISAFLVFYLIAPFLYRKISSIEKAYTTFVIFYLLSKMCNKFGEEFRILGCLHYFALGIIIYFAIKEKKEAQVIRISIIGIIIMMIYQSSGGLQMSLAFVVLLLVIHDAQCHNKLFLKIEKWFHKYTYSIYLVHALVLTLIEEIAGIQEVLLLPVFILCTFCISLMMYHCIEQPIQRYFCKRKWY